MKISKQLVIIVFFFLGAMNTKAQNQDIIPGGLSKEQLTLIKNQQELIATNREKFKASLTAEQLAILEDPKLNSKSQQAALLSSLSKEQKQFLADNIEKARVLKEEFKNTLTEDQRQQIKIMNDRKTRETIQESRKRIIPRK